MRCAHPSRGVNNAPKNRARPSRGAHVELPRGAGAPIRVRAAPFAAQVATLAAAAEPEGRTVAPAFVRVTRPPVERAALYRRPSAGGGETSFRVVERVVLGSRLPLVGDAVTLEAFTGAANIGDSSVVRGG